MKPKIWLSVAVFILAAKYMQAQQKVYSLEEVLQKSLQYPSLSAKKELLEQQKLNKKLVQQQALPEIHVQGQQSYGTYQTVPGSFFPLPGIYNSSGSNKNGVGSAIGPNLYTSALLQWDFMQFGRIQKRVAVADSGIGLSGAVLSLEEFRVQSMATRKYFAVLQSAALLNILKADVKRLSGLLQLLESQSGAGLRPGADTLLIKSALLQSQNKINDQQALLETSLLQLASLIGEDTADFSIDTSLYRRFTSERTIMENKSEQHPYLNYLKAAIGVSHAQLEAVKKDVYPSVGLLAGTGVRGSGIEADGNINKNIGALWSNNTGSYLVGVGITWNLSSLFQNKIKQMIASRELAAAKSNYQEGQLQLNTLYATAVARWKQQQQKLADARLAYTSAQQAYDLYTVRYENGLINLIELLQLQKSLQDAESNYITSIASWWNELIDQSEALGNPSFILNAINHN
ncbi:TolC family protein [Flavihumibacter sp. ZG627]|uniref:TolC family protein n=1 Tax=Flavihumibacter sp. ZG627 TaxID=1463156 RepID=UPI00057EAE41|nr:TolC family protein [Flavihumibacter sp. ZG627]KIC90288.1 hypothetical protein HY58_09945 [Flavihumibacter sp. ZG627]